MATTRCKNKRYDGEVEFWHTLTCLTLLVGRLRTCREGECVGYDKCAVSFPCTSDSLRKCKNKNRNVQVHRDVSFSKITHTHYSLSIKHVHIFYFFRELGKHILTNRIIAHINSMILILVRSKHECKDGSTAENLNSCFILLFIFVSLSLI